MTVVRLVTEGTIAEKVLRLHAEKRALYADAIGGLEGATKVDLRDMVGLLGAGAMASYEVIITP